ncbi:MAG TPA: hypothetical protein VHT91_35050 [Kofleriaceae bacterium]|jgi:hypothetical protein|nr:hypothetical protein [Kofleriaceae bacterium]
MPIIHDTRWQVWGLWIKHGSDHAHWEQAFSLDGETWEVNWMNDLTRADPAKICDGVHPRV